MGVTKLKAEYKLLNESFKKKLVFHIGSDAGFFSEYNNMILAMLYCLTNKIQFILYSEDSNFKYEKGWNDYFVPFCKEATGAFHSKYNFRDYDFFQQKLTRKDKLKIKLYKTINRIDFLTQDLWCKLRDKDLENKVFNIPELGINNNTLREACRVLISLTWEYTPKIDTIIKDKIRSLNLPTQYIGLHIRRGDKHIEHSSTDIDIYSEKMRSLGIKDIFVSTDDYSVIKDIENANPDYNFYHLCKEDQTGYNHSKIKDFNSSQIRESQLELFTSIEILASANNFIGTFSSNIGMYLAMRMDPKKCMSVDVNWQIW